MLLLLLGALAPGARAATLAQVPRLVPVGAHAGWVVWSVPAGGGWTLAAVRDGAPAALTVAPRAAPFDLDLGTDAAGRVVATFSRCRKEVAPPEDFLGDARVGCRVRVLDLASGQERGGGVPRPAGASDTMPSMWSGRIAFARTMPKASVDQVELWDPVRGRTRRLRHGAVPTDCANYEEPPCRRPPRNAAQVSALDLGPRVAAFRWNVQGESVTGYVASELRASTLDGRGSTLLARGFVVEACDESDSVTTYALGRPTAAGSGALFLTGAQRCSTSRTVLRRVAGALRSSALVPRGSVLRHAVVDGTRLIGLAPLPSEEDPGNCPCTLQSTELPRLRP